jgi:alpha-ribazole phosphatase
MLYFIRHAESLANTGGTTPDAAHIPLTEQGWQQAEALLDRFSQVDQIIVSPYLRTQQTAEPLLKRTGLTAQVWPIEEFHYLSSIKYANTSVEERKPMVDQYWHNADIHYCDGEDAESFVDFYQRIRHMLRHCYMRDEQYPDQTILVFTHGRVMQMLRLLITNPQPVSRELMLNFLDWEAQEPIWNTRVVALDDWQPLHDQSFDEWRQY